MSVAAWLPVTWTRQDMKVSPAQVIPLIPRQTDLRQPNTSTRTLSTKCSTIRRIGWDWQVTQAVCQIILTSPTALISWRLILIPMSQMGAPSFPAAFSKQQAYSSLTMSFSSILISGNILLTTNFQHLLLDGTRLVSMTLIGAADTLSLGLVVLTRPYSPAKWTQTCGTWQLMC